MIIVVARSQFDKIQGKLNKVTGLQIKTEYYVLSGLENIERRQGDRYQVVDVINIQIKPMALYLCSIEQHKQSMCLICPAIKISINNTHFC